MTTTRAVEALIREGEQELMNSLRFAKAAGNDEQEEHDGDLDSDFDELDEARDESDAAHEEDESEEDEGQDEGQDESEDEDEDEGQDDDEGQEQFSKAEDYETVDAGPLLEALDARLAEQGDMLSAVLEQNKVLAKAVQQLQTQGDTLAKAVQSSARATLAFAKAQQGAAELPLMPKSRAQSVSIPTRKAGAPAVDVNAVMAKAEEAVYDGRMAASQMSLLNTLANTHGMDAALEQFPPAIREMLTKK